MRSLAKSIVIYTICTINNYKIYTHIFAIHKTSILAGFLSWPPWPISISLYTTQHLVPTKWCLPFHGILSLGLFQLLVVLIKPPLLLCHSHLPATVGAVLDRVGPGMTRSCWTYIWQAWFQSAVSSLISINQLFGWLFDGLKWEINQLGEFNENTSHNFLWIKWPISSGFHIPSNKQFAFQS